jgi:hypothetical protein
MSDPGREVIELREARYAQQEDGTLTRVACQRMRKGSVDKESCRQTCTRGAELVAERMQLVLLMACRKISLDASAHARWL